MFNLLGYTQLDNLILPSKNIYIPFSFTSNKGKFVYNIKHIKKAHYLLQINKEKPICIKTKEKLLSFIKTHLKDNGFKDKLLIEPLLDIEDDILWNIKDNMSSKEIEREARGIVEYFKIIPKYFYTCIEITKSYIKHYGSSLKDHLWEMFEDYMLKNGFALALLWWEKARFAPLEKLALAKKMTKEKVHKEKIWIDTGWEKGSDNKWRFEINDDEAKVNIRPIFWISSLGDVLDHPLLFKNYPGLRNVKVCYIENGSCSISWKEDTLKMTLNKEKTFIASMSYNDIKEYREKRKKEGLKLVNDHKYKSVKEYIRESNENQWHTLKKIDPTLMEESTLCTHNVPSWLTGSFEEQKDLPIWLVKDPIEEKKEVIKAQEDQERKEEKLLESYKHLWIQLKCNSIKDEKELYKIAKASFSFPFWIRESKEVFYKESINNLLEEVNRDDCVRDEQGDKLTLSDIKNSFFSISQFRKLRGYRKIGFNTFIGPNASVRTEEGEEYIWYFSSIDSLSSILHETQHLIQRYETFACGWSPILEKYKYLDAQREEYSKIYLQDLVDKGVKNVTMDNAKEIQKHVEEYEKEKAKEIGVDIYKRLAGEVEARNVQRRHTLDKKIKRVAPPSTTEDTERKIQKVIFSLED